MNFNPDGRYDDDSEENRKKRKYGGADNEGKPWSVEEMDLLLDGRLVHNWLKYTVNAPSFQKELGRSARSVETMWWKVIAGEVQYIPWQRINREGTPFNDRDAAVIRGLVASEKSRLHGCCTILHLYQLLQRQPDSIVAWLYKLLAPPVMPLGLTKPITPPIGSAEEQFQFLIKNHEKKLLDKLNPLCQ